MRASLRSFARTLGQGISLSFWRRPDARVELVGFGIFLTSCALSLLVFLLHDFGNTPEPTVFYADAFHEHASYFLLVLLAAWLAARLLRRPALWMTLATLGVLVGIPWTAVSMAVETWLVEASDPQLYAWRILLAVAGFTVLLRMIGFVARDTPGGRRLAASGLFVIVLAQPWYWQQSAWFWYPPEEEEQASPRPDAGSGVERPPAAPRTSLRLPVEPETLLYQQPGRVAAAVAALRPQTPGRIDLFGVGFGGDGNERVFRNEVEYFSALMAQRFDARERTIALINSPDTAATVPLATLGNLRAALAGVATRMDASEDVLVLFLTSHGSEDHRLYVSLDPLPLRQIRPRDLRRALDEAGIEWRVVIVSACFSGGFVDALRDPKTLVVTAARRDRPSFGCGTASHVTWFGKAYLAQALNQTLDFEQAFDQASRQVREWELAEGETASVPQIAPGRRIRDHLAVWRQGAPVMPPVPFVPPPTGRAGATQRR